MKRFYSDYDAYDTRDHAYTDGYDTPQGARDDGYGAGQGAYADGYGPRDDARGDGYAPYGDGRGVSRRAPSPRSALKTRKKKKRRKNILRLVMFGLLGFSVVTLVWFFFFRETETVISMTETPITAEAEKLDIGSGMLYQTGNTLNYYDWSKSSRNYTETAAASNLRMTGSSTLAVVYTDTALQFVSSKVQRSFNGTILSVECGQKHIAVLWRNSSDKDSVIILDENGEQVDQLLADDAYIVNFGFYTSGGEMLWMQTLSVTATTPVTRVTTYDLTKHADSGVMQIQDQLIESLYFTTDSIFAVGTNQIIRFTYDNQEIYREMIYGYKVIDFSSGSGTPTFLLAPREGDMNAVRLLSLQEADSSGATDTHLQLPGEGVAGYIMNGSLVVLTENNVYTYSLLGKLSSEAKLEYPATEVEKISDSTVLILSGGVYYTAKVR